GFLLALLSKIGISPQSFSTINCATCISGVSLVQQAGSGVIMSFTCICVPFVLGCLGEFCMGILSLISLFPHTAADARAECTEPYTQRFTRFQSRSSSFLTIGEDRI